MASGTPIRTTCPYCGVGCGVLADVAGGRRGRDHRRPASIRPISAGSARRARRSARRSSLDGRLLHPEIDGRRAGWDEALDLVAATLLRDHRRARAGLGRLLRLGPVADRGLLRRQQADEGLHRLGQHRHQFAPLHGLVGRRPPPRLRRRHRARHLRGSRAGRPGRAGRLQPRLVPSRCCYQRLARGPGASAARRSSSSIRAAPRPPRSPTCIWRSRPTATWRCSTACSLISTGSALSTAPIVGSHTTGFDEALAGRSATRPSPASLRATGLAGRAARASSTRCSRRPSSVVTVYSARASTSRRRAPTRSTPSSTATWPPAASASPAWGRSRSPASPTPWAGARSAGWPTCSPRIMDFDNPDHRDRVQRFWDAPAHRRQAGPEGRRPVPRRRRRAASRRCGSWRPTRSSPARRRAVQDGACAAARSSSCPT